MATTSTGPGASTFSKSFSIDSGIFKTASITLDDSTDANALAAILANDKFPAGDIQLGKISVSADTGNVDVIPAAAGGAQVSFDLKASAQSGIGVYANSADAIKALNLADAIALKITDVAGDRYVLMDWGYTASLTASGSSPIGAFGSATLGVTASSDQCFAVLHRFADATEFAHTVMADTFASWRLPRNVAFADGDVNIKPGTGLIAEVDGSLGVKLGATLGWNVNYAKDLKLLGVTHDLSAKIDASLSANFGFNVSGNYIVSIGRETADPVVRMLVSRQKSKGQTFGVNLNVGIQGSDPQLPADFSDFIKSVFGVQGQQVLNDLQTWTSSSTDLGQKLAGLADQTVQDLLKKATGIDPATAFNQAKSVLTNALNTWTSLPTKLSSMLWTYLGQLGGSAPAADFKQFLSDLSSATTAPQAFADALKGTTFGSTPQGQFLESLADNGLLALGNDLGPVVTAAGQVDNLLNGGVITNLQSFINQKLDLSQIQAAVNAADPSKVDQWLQNRLSNFFDKTVGLDQLKDIQNAIQTLNTKVAGYYKTAVQALTKKYNMSFAATYASTTTDTALLDVNFNLSVPAAQSLYQKVIAENNLEDLFSTETAGVTLNQAKLTHDINRKGTIDLNLPWFDFSSTSVNDSMVTLTAEDQGGRVLLYQMNSQDTVTVANRSASQLSVLASLKVSGGTVQIDPAGSIAYEMRQTQAGMKALDFARRTGPFVQNYLAQLVAGGDSAGFFNVIDSALAQATGSTGGVLGDFALSMQLELSASALTAWLKPRDTATLKADQMTLSRSVQASWKDILPGLYIQSLDMYQANPTIAALLVWSSIPVSTSIDASSGTVLFNRDTDVYWDWVDVNLRQAVARDQHTLINLAARLTAIQTQLQQAGNGNAGFFDPAQAGQFIQQALGNPGDTLLQSLLFTEAQLVGGATDALRQASGAISSAASAPTTTAITTLAKFASDITNTFNSRASSVYSGVSGRVVGEMLLVEASKSLGSATTPPKGILAVCALKPGHTGDFTAFIASGTNPPAADIAASQTLVTPL